MLSYLEQTLKRITEFEGAVPWMYMDRTGKVRVGVGMVLPESATAKRLPFQVGTRAATESDIEAAFIRVAALPMGRPALFYRQSAEPELEPAVIDALLRTSLVGAEEQLREMVPGYGALPPGVKMALLDMAHDLTPAGVLTQYSALIHAIQARTWSQAASASFRYGAGAARNQWTSAMLQTSTLRPINTGQDSSWKRFCYGMVGLCATLASHFRRKSVVASPRKKIPSTFPKLHP